MAVAAGAKLCRYEILAPIGVGGWEGIPRTGYDGVMAYRKISSN
jgi:hypothetical protein